MSISIAEKPYTLFGGSKGWHPQDWTASDDRVRGGKSISYLDCTSETGTFRGNLDITTLGGAGFASQRTTQEDAEWDLSRYAGIELWIAQADEKRYTFNLKDELLPPDPNTGREQASVSYECDFELPPQTQPGDTHDKTVFIPWASFNATYRGRPQEDAKPINLKSVKRFSVMMRSFFGTQEGNFSLSIKSICALPQVPKHANLQQRDAGNVLEKVQHMHSIYYNYNGAEPAEREERLASLKSWIPHRWGAWFFLAAVSTLALFGYWHICV